MIPGDHVACPTPSPSGLGASEQIHLSLEIVKITPFQTMGHELPLVIRSRTSCQFPFSSIVLSTGNDNTLLDNSSRTSKF
jgi:hypothetical protein